MGAEPVDVTEAVLRALRLLDGGRRSAQEQWQRLTQSDRDRTTAPSDRHRPPQIW